MARLAGSGFVVTASGVTIQHRDLIAGLAARHRLPAVYPFRYFVTAGGLLSYGPDLNDQFRRAAGYINRILKGEKPADLPVRRHQVRAGDQPENREGAQPRRAADAARPRRRGDRVKRPRIRHAAQRRACCSRLALSQKPSAASREKFRGLRTADRSAYCVGTCSGICDRHGSFRGPGTEAA